VRRRGLTSWQPRAGPPACGAGALVRAGDGQALGRVARSRRYRSDVERAIFAMVCQRTIAPASKLEATRWAPREVVLPGVGELCDDGLYAAMDFLLECCERVQEAVFFGAPVLDVGERDPGFGF